MATQLLEAIDKAAGIANRFAVDVVAYLSWESEKAGLSLLSYLVRHAEDEDVGAVRPAYVESRSC
jgi:hypothetical protein